MGNKYKILCLSDINCNEDIAETGETLQHNAAQKAMYVSNKYRKNCFSDDTGLEVDALDGQPGVYSARYAGENCTPADNRKKLLSALTGISNREAHFRTVVALVINGKLSLFEGKIDGTITTCEKGEKGFGYDALFVPKGYTQTFAEINSEIKNSISHRFNAINKMKCYLEENGTLNFE
jgi:XTP/dITP diphosphohydrolase